MKRTTLFISIAVFLISCSIQKRQYRSGYYIQWKSKIHNEEIVIEKPSQTALKRIGLPKLQEPKIKTEEITRTDFKSLKKLNKVVDLPMIRAEIRKSPPRFYKKANERKKTDLASVGISLFLIDILLALAILIISNFLVPLTLGMVALIGLILIVIFVLAILFLIIGIITRLAQKNKTPDPPSKS